MDDFQKRVLECALYYGSRGWKVLPLHTVIDGRCTCGKTDCPSPGKHPATASGFKDAAADEQTIRGWFGGGKAYNVGIAAGKESGLVVMDVDPKNGGDQSIQDYKLPQTLEVITGSGGRHYYFQHPQDAEIRNSAGKLGRGLDVRGDGGYVVAPPSIHASGNEYRWAVDPRAISPATWPEELRTQQPGARNQQKENEEISPGERNETLTSIAGAMRRQGCDAQAIYAALININQRRCRPPLNYEELKKIAESIGRYPPEEEEPFTLPDDHPDTIAGAFENWSQVRHRHHVDTWTIIRDRKYHQVDEREVKKWIRRFAVQCKVRRRVLTDGGFKTIKERLKVTTHLTCGILEALSALEGVWIQPKYAPPAWLDISGQRTADSVQKPKAEDVIALRDCLLDVSGSQPRRMDLTEELYTLNYLPIEYDPQAKCPKWLAFLGQVFQTKQLSSDKTQWSPEADDFVEVYETTADQKSIDILQEFMGLLMTPVTRYQKILGIVGPKRSGKGTIGRIIRALAGSENVCSPTLSSLTNEHGLQGLYLKTVALIGDASINSSNADTARAVERLKSISGEDSQQVNPKGKAYIEVEKMGVRFVIMANELQKLSDTTGALAGRFVYLLTTQSFYGREDVHLDEKLAAELPGIFNWAMEGYFRLKRRGHFLETEAGMEARAMAEELGSPVISFVREWCMVKDGRQIRPQELYEAYRRWCEEAGRSKMGRTRFYEEFQRAYPECGRSKVRVNFGTEQWNNSGTGPVWVFQNIDLQDEYRAKWA
jgi:putative DNA primase/helicase